MIRVHVAEGPFCLLLLLGLRLPAVSDRSTLVVLLFSLYCCRCPRARARRRLWVLYLSLPVFVLDETLKFLSRGMQAAVSRRRAAQQEKLKAQ